MAFEIRSFNLRDVKGLSQTALTREAAVRRFPFEYNGVVLHELFF